VGIVTQIEDGVAGWLVDSSAAAAAAALEILGDPAAARQRAARGKEAVRQRFLPPRLLRDWLTLFNRLAGDDAGEVELVSFQAAA
jgi:trehalose synthase